MIGTNGERRKRASGEIAAALLFATGALVFQQPTFRAAVEYVSVDVIVTGHDDQPITNLKQDEFEITEGGKKQAISDFQFVSVPLEHRTIDVTEAAAAPEPDVVANTPPPRNSRQFVMVVDDLHILASEIVPVKRMMTDFIRALSPDDEVSIVFVGHSDLSQNFTKDVGKLLKTVDNVKAALGFGLDADQRPCSLDIRPTPPRYPNDADPRLLPAGRRAAAMELQNVARALAQSSYTRRAIVYVSRPIRAESRYAVLSLRIHVPRRTPRGVRAGETGRRADLHARSAHERLTGNGRARLWRDDLATTRTNRP